MTVMQQPGPLPCFACGRDIADIFPDVGDELPWPKEALRFISSGNYGSLVFDPAEFGQHHNWLQINICDDCVLVHSDRVWHYKSTDQAPLITFSQPWNPQLETQPEQGG